MTNTRESNSKDCRKKYNNLSDIELQIIRDYNSWKKSDCPIPLKLEELLKIRKRANEMGIGHLL